MLHITLIRHGETDANRALRFQGHADIPLNATGQLQSRRLAAALAGQGLLAATAGAYSSDLRRAVQTAQLAMAGRQTAALSRLATLREQCFGVLEGLTMVEAREAYPDVLQDWMQFDADFALPGGESTRAFHQRVMLALTDIAVRHEAMPADQPGRRVLIFTHGGVVDMVWRHLTGQPLSGPRTSEIPNVGMNHVRWDGDQFHLQQWADARHVADLPAQPRYEQRQFVTRP